MATRKVSSLSQKTKSNAYYNQYKNTGNLNCYICDKETFPHLKQNHPDRTTIDHVIPKSKGGSNRMSNLRICCYECNQGKKDEVLSNKI